MDGWCCNDVPPTVWCKACERIIMKMWSTASQLDGLLRLINGRDYLLTLQAKLWIPPLYTMHFLDIIFLSNWTSSCPCVIYLCNAIPSCVALWEFMLLKPKISSLCSHLADSMSYRMILIQVGSFLDHLMMGTHKLQIFMLGISHHK